MTAALLACGLPAYEAAACAVYLHGAAATVPLLRLASTECCRMISCPSWPDICGKPQIKRKGVSLCLPERHPF